MKVIVVKPECKNKKASDWLANINTLSLAYRIAVLLLQDVRHPECMVGLDDGCAQYDRLLRQLERAGRVESEYEMKWRLGDYSTNEAETWARESLQQYFNIIDVKS